MAKPISKKPLKVLISAYACEPSKGSEPAIGWDWVTEIANRGHHLVVFTRLNNKNNIESFLHQKKLNLGGTIRFEYYDLPKFVLFLKKKFSLTRVYYLFWQFFVFKRIKNITQEEKFDFVHHLTFVSLRHFTHLGKLNIPLILGPLAGGDSSPYYLRKSINWYFFLSEYFRDFTKFCLKFDPFFLNSLKKAKLIICATPATKNLVPDKFLNKTKIINQISMEIPQEVNFQNTNNFRNKNILFVGKLIDLKGMSIGLEAFSLAIKKDPKLFLTIIGTGVKEKDWKLLAKNLEIQNRIKWIPWVNQTELKKIYPKYSTLIFPSLHDSGGQVILEAVSHGLKVIALDIGGPGYLLNNDVAKIIEVKNSSYSKVKEEIAKGILSFSSFENKIENSFKNALNLHNKLNISAIIDKIGIY